MFSECGSLTFLESCCSCCKFYTWWVAVMWLGERCVLEFLWLLSFGDILMRVGRWNYREWTVFSYGMGLSGFRWMKECELCGVLGVEERWGWCGSPWPQKIQWGRYQIWCPQKLVWVQGRLGVMFILTLLIGAVWIENEIFAMSFQNKSKRDCRLETVIQAPIFCVHLLLTSL